MINTISIGSPKLPKMSVKPRLYTTALIHFRSQSGFNPLPVSIKIAADIFLPCWSLGQPAALDVLMISSLHDLTITEAALTALRYSGTSDERPRSGWALPWSLFGGWSRSLLMCANLVYYRDKARLHES